MDFRDKDFDRKRILLDGNVFSGCTFRNCRLLYRGHAPPKFSACNFKQNVKWVLDGQAADTIKFLTKLNHSTGESGRKAVEQVFKKIRGTR